jgi:hypothetical protein
MTDTPRTEADTPRHIEWCDACAAYVGHVYPQSRAAYRLVDKAAAGPRDEVPSIGRNSLLGKSLTDEEFAAIAGRRNELRDLFARYIEAHGEPEEWSDDGWCMKHLPTVAEVITALKASE